MAFDRKIEVSAIVFGSIFAAVASGISLQTLWAIEKQNMTAIDQLSLMKAQTLALERSNENAVDQLFVLKSQALTLERSVAAQEASAKSQNLIDEYEIKRFLLEKLSPKVDQEQLPTLYSGEDGGFAISWSLRNLGNSQVVLADTFAFDLVRCSTNEAWVADKWERDYSSDLGPDINYFDENIFYSEIYSGEPQNFEHIISFPPSAYSNFQIGEKIAIEYVGTIFSPDERHFIDQIEALNFADGRSRTVAGRKVAYPAIVEVITSLEMFKLTNEGWTKIPLEQACIDYVR